MKQETPADFVIEEGSDDYDNSFASDTPADGMMKRRGERGKKQQPADDFSKATRLMKKERDDEVSPVIDPKDNMSNAVISASQQNLLSKDIDTPAILSTEGP